MIFAEFRCYLMWFIICGVGQTGSMLIKVKNMWRTGTTNFKYFFFVFPLTSQRKAYRNVCKTLGGGWGVRWNMKMNGNVWTLKWCKNYSNVASSGMPFMELVPSLSGKLTFWIELGEGQTLPVDLSLQYLQLSYPSFPRLVNHRCLLKADFVLTYLNLHILTNSAAIAQPV